MTWSEAQGTGRLLEMVLGMGRPRGDSLSGMWWPKLPEKAEKAGKKG